MLQRTINQTKGRKVVQRVDIAWIGWPWKVSLIITFQQRLEVEGKIILGRSFKKFKRPSWASGRRGRKTVGLEHRSEVETEEVTWELVEQSMQIILRMVFIQSWMGRFYIYKIKKNKRIHERILRLKSKETRNTC